MRPGAALALTAVLAVGCDQYRTATLTRDEVVTLPRAAPAPAMERAIEAALIHRRWAILSHKARRYRARLEMRDFWVEVAVDYDARGFAVRYVGSEGLLHERYGDGTETIHRKYLTWVKNLENDIRERVMTAQLAAPEEAPRRPASPPPDDDGTPPAPDEAPAPREGPAARADGGP